MVLVAECRSCFCCISGNHFVENFHVETRTLGPGNFPEDITITITITAKDAVNNGQDTVATISVLVGVRPPQFYQSSYQGAMPEKNRPQQT